MLPDLSHNIIADKQSIEKRKRYLQRLFVMLVLGLVTIFASVVFF